MKHLSDMIWIETRKAIRSHMPFWVSLASLFMPLGIAFLIFVARNPEFSQTLGLVTAKANLLVYAAIDWPAYLDLCGQIIAGGGFAFFTMVIAWVFGREFADGTAKDFLAVPVPRAHIILAKFIVMAVWCGLMALLMYAMSLVMGVVIGLPGASADVLSAGSLRMALTALMTVVVIFPFALVASYGRGYLLPIGTGILMLVAVNIAVVLGWADYIPWAVPGIYSQAASVLPPVSYALVLLTGLAGVAATIWWWQRADQNK